ncbi:MAG: hypothetical protein PVH42_22370, partial [Desulfobacterales bacterium]
NDEHLEGRSTKDEHVEGRMTIESVQGFKGSGFRGYWALRDEGLDLCFGLRSITDCDVLKIVDIKQLLNLGTLNL